MQQQHSIVDALQGVIDFVYQNKCPWYVDFWRQQGLFSKPDIETAAAFTQLPMVTKQDFVSSGHPHNYTFVPLANVLSFRSTSGTTGTELFVFPRGCFSPDLRTTLVQNGAKSFLYMGGVQKNATTAFDYLTLGMKITTGDLHRLNEVPQLVIQNQVDTISATPTALLRMGPLLVQSQCESMIRYIVIYGELLTHDMRTQIQALYPQANIYTEYSLSESGQGIAYTTPACDLDLNCYHSHESAHCEIVEGEIVITTLAKPHPLPLIRYRTGDAAKWREHKCSCGHISNQVFELTGRINVDVVKVGGLELRYSALEKSVQQLPSTIVIDSISATVAVNKDNQISIHLYVALSLETKVVGAIASTVIQEVVQDHWFLTQTKSLAHYIANQRCLHPVIHLVDNADQLALKKVGIKLITDS